jgi:hypothetical protein
VSDLIILKECWQVLGVLAIIFSTGRSRGSQGLMLQYDERAVKVMVRNGAQSRINARQKGKSSNRLPAEKDRDLDST